MIFTVGMTIWILALVLLAASIALGHKLGAINASFTFVGIIVAALLAGPVGGIFKHLLPHIGISNQTAVWAASPIVAFLVVLVLFKMAGFFVHRKVEMFYKYKAGDLRLALWERLNARLGACIGTLNGTAYVVLLSFLIFNFSYWTVQVMPTDDESRSTKLVNRLGNDLQGTGLAKPAHSLVTMPENFYKLADLAGLISQNPQLSDRLANYPAFISLVERDDLRQLAQNADFTNAWNSHAPMGSLLNQPAFKTILQNTELIDIVWTTVQTNLPDLMNYLQTGKSAKYDEQKILGRWDFNVSTSVAMLRQARPNIPASEMKVIRALWTQGYADTTFVAGGDGQAFLKNLPDFKNKPPTPQTWKGSWTANDTNYNLSLSGNPMTAQINGTRLTLKDDKNTYVFDRED
jgi:Colicin V production protein